MLFRSSEFNASDSDPIRLLQIWIQPNQTGLTPGYEQKMFSAAEKQGRLRLVASADGRDGSVTIHQDANLHAGLLGKSDQIRHTLAPGRHAYLQVARGEVQVNGLGLSEGDGAALTGEDEINLTTATSAEVLLFDLA